MKMKMKPELKKMTEVYSNPYGTMYEVLYKNRKDADKIFYSLSSAGRTIENLNDVNTTAVTVFLLNESRTKCLLLDEYRMGVGGFVFNSVSGLIDENETAEEALYREIREETGLTLLEILEEFDPSYSSSGIGTEMVTPFIGIVSDKEEMSFTDQEDNEYIEPLWLTKHDLKEKLAEKVRFGARTQLFVYMFLNGLFDK